MVELLDGLVVLGLKIADLGLELDVFLENAGLDLGQRLELAQVEVVLC